MNKQDGVYTRTAAALEQKNSYGKRFAEVLKIADDARDKVASVESSLEDVKDRVAAAESEIKELPGKISLTVKNGSIGNTASIVLRVGDKEYPGTINLTGAVTFNDLTTSGKTNINGSNITTGTIKSKNYSYTSGNDFATNGMAIELEKGVVRSKNFAIDENGDVSVKGTIAAGAGSKMGPWIFGENKIEGIQSDTSVFHVRNPFDNSKMTPMYVSKGSFILDGYRIRVDTTVEWGNEVSFTSGAELTVEELGEYFGNPIIYGKTEGWSRSITWERLAALGGDATNISPVSTISDS